MNVFSVIAHIHTPTLASSHTHSGSRKCVCMCVCASEVQNRDRSLETSLRLLSHFDAQSFWLSQNVFGGSHARLLCCSAASLCISGRYNTECKSVKDNESVFLFFFPLFL